jgi:hypothetical protein
MIEHIRIAEDGGVARRENPLIAKESQAELWPNPSGVAHRNRDSRQ